MNCRRGDWAMYVGKIAEIRGQIAQCAEADYVTFGEPAWHLAPHLGGKYDRALDRALIPIRDPGPGAVDEMLVVTGKRKERT